MRRRSSSSRGSSIGRRLVGLLAGRGAARPSAWRKATPAMHERAQTQEVGPGWRAPHNSLAREGRVGGSRASYRHAPSASWRRLPSSRGGAAAGSAVSSAVGEASLLATRTSSVGAAGVWLSVEVTATVLEDAFARVLSVDVLMYRFEVRVSAFDFRAQWRPLRLTCLSPVLCAGPALNAAFSLHSVYSHHTHFSSAVNNPRDRATGVSHGALLTKGLLRS